MRAVCLDVKVDMSIDLCFEPIVTLMIIEPHLQHIESAQLYPPRMGVYYLMISLRWFG